jgi:hypothetical protein
MSLRLRISVGLAFSLSLVVVFASVAPAQTYTVTDLGVLSGDSAGQGLAVNSSGQVVGRADTSTSGSPCSGSFPGHARSSGAVVPACRTWAY